jgi:hypothetical protein
VLVSVSCPVSVSVSVLLVLKFKISFTCANCVERHKFDKFKLDTDIQWKETKNTIETLDVKTHNWLKNVKVEINSVPKEIID